MKSVMIILMASGVLSFQISNLPATIQTFPVSTSSSRILPTCAVTLPSVDGPGHRDLYDRRCGLVASMPPLTDEEISRLQLGEDVRKQFVSGRTGSGFVTMDVPASSDDVWALLTDYAGYEQMIDTVRSATIKPGATLERTSAAYTLSKFKLEVNVVQSFDAAAQHLFFELDSSGHNFILKDALGVWVVETEAPGLLPGHVRLWLCSEISVCRVIPSKIIKYASQRALPRATTWIRPEIEAKRLSRS